MADLNKRNLVLGKGKVYFDKYTTSAVIGTTKGEGERYLGNTPEFSISVQSNKIDHFDSDSQVKAKDASVQLDLNRSGKITCDNVNALNLATWFQGVAANVVQAGAVGVVETLTVKKGRWYQLGATESLPAGVRGIENLVVKSGSPGFAVTVAATGNYQVDEVLGRVYIEDAALVITDDLLLQFTYDTLAGTRDQVISGSTAIYGALRFVSDNPTGDNHDHYYPYCMLMPNGDHALKGDAFMQFSFTFEALKKASNIETCYIDGRAA